MGDGDSGEECRSSEGDGCECVAEVVVGSGTEESVDEKGSLECGVASRCAVSNAHHG